MTDIVVRPVRFTDNLDRMQAFLCALGLRPRLESDSGGWVDMVAGGGMVALHSAKDAVRKASSGLTSLSFEADDIDDVAKRLQDAGVHGVTVYDESYGRVLTCLDPLGDQIAIDERNNDLYGYHQHDPEAVVPSLRVMPVRFTDPLGSYGKFLEALGLSRRGEPSEHFTAYTLGDGTYGVVGLHPVSERVGGSIAEPGAVDLSFETSEPLPDIAERLGAAGFAAQITSKSFGDVVSVTDGDGEAVEVHQAPPARRVIRTRADGWR